MLLASCMLSNGRKAPCSLPIRPQWPTHVSQSPDYLMPCDESYALRGVFGGGDKGVAVLRLIGTSAAAPQLARRIPEGSGWHHPIQRTFRFQPTIWDGMAVMWAPP
jgi:hypothetical protein